MASFAKSTFDVANYLACRGMYPSRIYDIIKAYHALNGGRFDRALDLGCGPGFMALNLAPYFKSVKAIDPASKMVAIGLQPKDPSIPRIDYQVGSAERLDLVGIGSGEEGVDLVVAGQAAHWFDFPKVWKELTRVVRPSGTVAFLGYAEALFPNHPKLNHLITEYSVSQNSLGPYWSQPGRSIVEGLLDRVPFPVEPTSPFPLSKLPGLTTSGPPIPSSIPEPSLVITEALKGWDPSSAVRLKKDQGSDEPWLMKKMFTLKTLEGYFRTFSSLHEWHLAHPEDRARIGKGEIEGDIVDRLIGRIRRGLEEDGGRKGGEGEGEVEIGWPLVLMMIKKQPA